MRSERNIMRHEFIGLNCDVVGSTNKSMEGISGKIMDETMKTIVIGEKRVQKTGTVFRMEVNGKKVRIDGDAIVSRPEDRIKKKFKKW